MDNQVDPAQMAVLSSAEYTLIALYPWDAKTKCPRTGKLRIRGKSPIHTDWTTRPYRNADALAHAANGGNVGVRLTASDLVVDVDPRNIEGGQKGILLALKAIGLNPSDFPTVLTGGGGLHLYMTKPSHLSIVDGLPDFLGRRPINGSVIQGMKQGGFYVWNILVNERTIQ